MFDTKLPIDTQLVILTRIEYSQEYLSALKIDRLPKVNLQVKKKA